jgi:replicative superfamily II helicase
MGTELVFVEVVIKGTQVYDSSKGQFTDLSVLDVLQVFGRAGRPGLETSGEGYICTTEDKLTHYLDAVTAQVCPLLPLCTTLLNNRTQNPIESQFVAPYWFRFILYLFVQISQRLDRRFER